MKKLLVALLVFTSSLFASIGSISSFKGSVKVQRDAQTLRGKINLPIEQKDIISTRNNSNAIIKFNDGTIITIGKNASLNIAEYIYDDTNKQQSKTSFQFLKGSFKTVTGVIGKVNPSKFKLSTKTASIGIRGTVTAGNQELVAVTVGSVGVTAQNKTVIVNAGEYVTTIDTKISPAKKLTDKIISMLSKELGTPVKTDSNSTKSLDNITKTVKKAVTVKKSSGGDDSGSGSSGDGGH